MTETTTTTPATDTPAVGKLTNTIIECVDLEAAVPFYKDQLGMSEVFAGESFVVLDGGSGTLVLWQGKQSEIVIAFTGANLDEARKQLEARGVDVGPNDKHPTGDHFYVKDPEGHPVMIST
jgi:catechol 2,3-dioxygenase-like lactoylglutathione lyase family enzyme